jgi:hypothetical protein
MRFGFRKSIRIGGLKLNLSKTGIGASAGIKGLRLGINAKGKTYISGGKHGIYYRETLGQKGKSSLSNNSFFVDDNETNKGCFLVAIGVFCFILGLFSPMFFIVPLIQIILFIREISREKRDKTNSEVLIDAINDCIQKNDIKLLISKLSDVNEKIITTYYKSYVFKNTYSRVIENILNDRNITCDEEIVINTYKSNLDFEMFNQINAELIDSIVTEVLSDSVISNNEEAQLKQILEHLPLKEKKKLEVVNIINDMKVIEERNMSI